MQLIFSTQASLIFVVIFEHIDAFVPSWHEFKIFVAVEIALLHSPPFTKNHFHFLLVVDSATAQLWLQLPRQKRSREGHLGLWVGGLEFPSETAVSHLASDFYRQLRVLRSAFTLIFVCRGMG